ncbi:MAG: hypothetical protein AAB383_02055 [Patescibacteria group bacterium]
MNEAGLEAAELLLQEGALALKPRAEEGVSDSVRNQTGRSVLRLVGAPPTAKERLDCLEEIGNPADFAEPGSVSFQLMQEVYDNAPKVAREKLTQILAKVAPLHLRPVVAALTKAIEEKRLDGMSWKQITDGIKLEIPLQGHAITVADINGYTACLLKGEYHEKVQTATDIVRTFNEVAKATGAVLVEPVEGDAGMFLTFNAAQQVELESELKRKIPMRIKKLEKELHADGTDKYPVDPETGERVFKKSVGVETLKQIPGELKMVVYSGKGIAQGAVVVSGEARDAAVEYQKKAGPGETLKQDLKGYDVKNPDWNKDPELPDTINVAVKLIEALLKVSPYSAAAFQDLIHSSKDEGAEVRSAKMNAYYLALELSPAPEDDAQKVDAFWELLTQEGTGDDRIRLFKPGGSRGMHFWTQGITSSKDFTQAFGAFNQRINRFATECGLTFRLSLGYEDALELILLPDSFQVDATGPSIVATVRGIAALEGKGDGNWISVDRSAVTAMGLVGMEMTTIYIKGTPYQTVQGRLEPDGKWELRESLVGREKQEAEINSFIASLGLNGVALRVHKPANAKDSGYGESALLRAAERAASGKGIQVVQLKNKETLFDDLEAQLGYSCEELINNPQLLTRQVLLTLDEDSFSPDLAARLDRFLFAMAGTPLGIIYTGAYQFRPEAFMGDAYSGKELSKDIEVDALSTEAALDLIFKARPDLKPQDRPLIAQLLAEWGKPLVPRALIRNFAQALFEQGDGWELKPALLEQAHAGALDYALEAAGLNETDRTVLGVVAEIGYGVPLEFIQNVLGFDCAEALGHLLDEAHPFLVLEGGLYSVRESSSRQARLLARKYQPAVHAELQKRGFLREDPVVDEQSLDRSMLELEHALAHVESCKSPRTLLLMARLGHYYLKERKNFGAAYGLYHRFLEACEGHELDLGGLPEDLLHDLVWALLETSHEKDTKWAQLLIKAHSEVSTPELMWREKMRLLRLTPNKDLDDVPEGDAYSAIVAQIREASERLNAKGITLHAELIKDIQSLAAFTKSAQMASEADSSQEVLSLAFAGAALSRLSCAARQLVRLAKLVEKKLPEELEFARDLRAAGSSAEFDTQRRLLSLGINLAGLDATSGLDQELMAEILRCLLDTYKYLASTPSAEEMNVINRYHDRAAKSFSKLERPVQYAALDAFDVQANAFALHWQRKLPLPGIFPGEIESTATSEDKAVVWEVLSDFETKVRVQLNHAIRNALVPMRHRLTHQLMNFIQLKMRLLKRTFHENDRQLVESLDDEYLLLAQDSARVCLLFTGETQDDYYALECAPIKKAVDQISTASQV